MRTTVTLTMNPALDVSADVPYVLPDQKLRCTAPRYEPGGGGINVARAMRRFGNDPLACFPIGGPTGDLLQRLLNDERVRCDAVPVRGWTRENVNVREQVSGRQFRFCMPGAPLGDDEWPGFLARLDAVAPAPDYLVASGSLPPGVPVDFYARVADLGHRRGSRLVLDSSGDALAAAVARGVYLLKPSLREFRALCGAPAEDEAALVALAVEAVTVRRWCDVLVLSLGAGGALCVSADVRERLAAPAVTVRSTVGAGDSMVAAIVDALARDRPVRDAVRLGVAAGAAAVMNPGTELCHRADVERLAVQVGATAL